MGTVTLGVSIAVPEPYGSLLQERRASFGDPAAHGIPTHVTLLPPTEVDSSLLPAVGTHLAAVAAAGRSFPMRLSGTGTFRPLSPVVFVQVVEGAAACSWLQKRVRDASGPLQRELYYPYHPHVTVAHDISEEGMDRAYEELSEYGAQWSCSGFALYEQGADGVWRKLCDYAFGGGTVPGGVPAQNSPVDEPTTPRRPNPGLDVRVP
ncbi:2'-5' RNA ligase family protein [Streptomyces sp. H27-C3]|uniref:2'-5' RNA ligase family protein n=1 Tax=Streptomyces sp. H27-C3 TaxID=3046305 RepID=UPI0024B9A0E1|nr:2'-5' RNA ligase family protein [Streptomyces sp. H27-C3]MDJ0464070.1 2'-5' RNA ligase family protein [Streptomyces sp. H27-C3]